MELTPICFEDFACSKAFGIDDGIDTHLLEEVTILRHGVFSGIDSGYRFASSKRVRQHAASDVARLFGRYGDKEVALMDAAFPETAN